MCYFTITIFVCGHSLTEMRLTSAYCHPAYPCQMGASNPPLVQSSNDYCENCVEYFIRESRERSRSQRPRSSNFSADFAEENTYSIYESRRTSFQQQDRHWNPEHEQPRRARHGEDTQRPRGRQQTRYEAPYDGPSYQPQEDYRPRRRQNEEYRYQEMPARHEPERPSPPPPPPPPPPPTQVPTLIPNPYIALGIPRDADVAAIRKAYRKLILTCHPDKVTDESKKAAATARFLEVQEAYELLSNSERKKAYDEGL